MTVEVAKTEADLQEAKILDDLAFGVGPGIIGISLEELREIQQAGAVLLLRMAGLGLIAESQIVTAPIAGAPQFKSDEAFCYGTAVHPNHQGKGLAQVMFEAQELVAKEAGKEKMIMTVRVENVPSIRAILKAGYLITGYDPNHYGSVASGGARLWMSKNLDYPAKFNPAALASELQKKPSEITLVSVCPGLNIDLDAHGAVQELLSNGYKGLGLLNASQNGNRDEKVHLVFRKTHD